MIFSSFNFDLMTYSFMIIFSFFFAVGDSFGPDSYVPIRGLVPGTTYILSLTAFNAAGKTTLLHHFVTRSMTGGNKQPFVYIRGTIRLIWIHWVLYFFQVYLFFIFIFFFFSDAIRPAMPSSNEAVASSGQERGLLYQPRFWIPLCTVMLAVVSVVAGVTYCVRASEWQPSS